MKKLFTFLMFFLLATIVAQAENATMAAGTNGSTAKVNDKEAIKVGTSSAGGSMTITVGAGATSLEFYAAAWNKVTGLSLNITPTANVSPTSVSLTADTGIAGNSPFTLSGTESSYKFTITLSNITTETTFTLTSSAAKRFVVWGATYTSGGVTPPTPTTYNVNIANDIANGTVTSSATSAAEGATVTLTATPATGYEFGSWNVTNASTSDAISVTDNKFTMPAANVNVNATFNEMTALTTMDEIFAAATAADKTAKDVYIKFNNWIVSGLNGTKNAYLTDNSGKGLIIFDNGGAHGFETGDVLNGTVNCKVQLFNGAAELTALTSTTSGLTVTKGGSITEQNIAIAELLGVNTGALVSYENLTYHLNGANAEFSDGENVIVAYKGIMNTLPELIEGKIYDIKGVFLMYGTKKEILPRSAEDIVLKETINKFSVTFDVTENGTIIVKDGETIIKNGDEVAEGTTLTIECTPASADYRFKNWQYKAGEATWATRTADFSYTMPSANVQFRANYELIPVYTVAWSVNGTVVKTEDLKEGATVTEPNVDAINNKVFTGWVTTSTVASDATPSYVIPSATATANVTYYAVFATQTGESGTTYVKQTNNNLDWDANYVLAAEESSTENTLHYFSSYDNYNTTANISWGGTSTDVENALILHVENNANGNVSIKDNKNNYITPLATGKFRMNTNKQELTLKDNGTIFNPSENNTDYNLRYNHNNGSGGFRWYSGTTGTSAYLYKITQAATYSDFTTTPGSVVPPTEYSIEISKINNGSVTASAETATAGTEITLTATPADGYKFEAWSVKDANDNDVVVTDNKFTMPASDVTVSATFEAIPQYTYTWHVNGQVVKTETLDTNTNISVPTTEEVNANIPEGKVFQGWIVNTPYYNNATTAPEYATIDATATATTDYYAIFATENPGVGTRWQKITIEQAKTSGDGEYAILAGNFKAFNGTISSGKGQLTSTAFAFDENGYAQDAPEGTCIFTFTRTNNVGTSYSSNGYTMYNSDHGYLYSKDNTSGNLAWHQTEDSYWYPEANNWRYKANSTLLRQTGENANNINTYGSNATGTYPVIIAKKVSGGVSYSNFTTGNISLKDLEESTNLNEETVTIADELTVVHVYDNDANTILWAKSANEANPDNFMGKEDLMSNYKTLFGENAFNWGNWDESHWIMIDCASSDVPANTIIPGGTITGEYQGQNNVSYKLIVSDEIKNNSYESTSYTKNLYCMSNFDDSNFEDSKLQSGDKTYYLVQPKIDEVCTITGAIWNGNQFVIAADGERGNSLKHNGAIALDLTYNSSNDLSFLKEGNAYSFDVIVKEKAAATTSSNAPQKVKVLEEVKTINPKENQTATYTVYPINLNEEDTRVVTGIDDITVNSAVKAYKVIENGQVIIVRGDQRFNIMGQPVR